MPFLTEPPHPQRFFNSAANFFNSSSDKSKPLITDTPAPFLPLVCFWIRTTPSPFERTTEAISSLIRPTSVEYTKTESDIIITQ